MRTTQMTLKARWWRQLFPHLLFFGSGLSGLGFQMVWSRLFGLGLGHEWPGLLGVLGGFFAGIALGGWALDKTISRSRNPGRWYGGLELVIGGWGLLTLWVVPAMADFGRSWLGVEGGAGHHWFVAFSIPFLSLLPATASMGASFPALERFVSSRGSQKCVGGLYAANTGGAVIGALLSPFVLVPILGFRLSLVLLSGLNLACGLGGLWMARMMPAEEDGRRLETPPSLAARRVLVLLFFSGLFGIGFEVVGVRVLSQVLDNTIYSFAAALCVYLLGTALGAAFEQKIAARRGPPPFRGLLAGLGSSCVASGFVLAHAARFHDSIRSWFSQDLGGVFAVEFTLAALVFGVPTLFMGALFSALVQEARREDGGVGTAIAFNTIGSAMAPSLFGLWLLPGLGAKWALAGLGAGYAVLSLSETVGSTRPKQLRASEAGRKALKNFAGVRTKFSVSDSAAAERAAATQALGEAPAAHGRLRGEGWSWGWAWGLAPVLLILFLPQDLRMVQAPPGGALQFYLEGVLGSVAVVRHFEGNRSLLLNNRFTMGGTGAAEAARRHAHVPLLLHPGPRHALFLGLGTGISMGAAAAHAGLEADGVELVPEVVEAMSFFSPENGQPNPALRVHTADARRFVRVVSRRYDVIVADLFHPARDGAGSLYTLEHYRAIRERLAPGGLFCQWLPLFQLDEPVLQMITRTLLTVFPNTRAFLLRLNIDTPVLGLIDSAGPAQFSGDWFEKRVQDTALAASLKAAGLQDSLQLFGLLWWDNAQVRAFAKGGRLNTDDCPLVSFEAPRFAAQRSVPPYLTLERLLQLGLAPDPRTLISGETDAKGSDFARQLGDYLKARDLYLKGLMAEAKSQSARSVDLFLASARASDNFTTGYAHLLTLAMQQVRENPEAARRILDQLAQVQTNRPVARRLRERLFPNERSNEAPSQTD